MAEETFDFKTKRLLILVVAGAAGVLGLAALGVQPEQIVELAAAFGIGGLLKSPMSSTEAA